MTKPAGYGPRKKKPTMADTFRENEEKAQKVNTSIWINPDYHRRLKILAATNDTTISALIEEGVKTILDKTEQP